MTNTTPTPSALDLLPCPFCGGTDILIGALGPGCGGCGAIALSTGAWNSRAAQPGAEKAAEGSITPWRERIAAGVPDHVMHAAIANAADAEISELRAVAASHRTAGGDLTMLRDAIDQACPLPDSPHASVIQRANDERAAMWRGAKIAQQLLAAPAQGSASQVEGHPKCRAGICIYEAAQGSEVQRAPNSAPEADSAPGSVAAANAAGLLNALQPLAAYPLEDFNEQCAPDDKRLFGAADWYLTVGHVRRARQAVEAARAPATSTAGVTDEFQRGKLAGLTMAAEICREYDGGWYVHRQGARECANAISTQIGMEQARAPAADTEGLRVKLSCIYAAGVAKMDPTQDYERVIAHFANSPAAVGAEGLPPAEYDENMDRHYLPLPGGWEVQTKGKGSTFRIAHVDTGRWMVLDEQLHVPLEQMARDIRDAVQGSRAAKGAAALKGGAA